MLCAKGRGACCHMQVVLAGNTRTHTGACAQVYLQSATVYVDRDQRWVLGCFGASARRTAVALTV